MYSLEQIADMLESAPRSGEPGRQYVQLSDKILRAFAVSLRKHARGEPPNAVPLNRR